MIAYVFQKYPENYVFQLFIILQYFTREIRYSLKKQPTFEQFLLSFPFKNKTFRLNNLKTTTAVNAKIPVFVICVEVIIQSLLFNFHDRTFKIKYHRSNEDLLHREFVLFVIDCGYLIQYLSNSNIYEQQTFTVHVVMLENWL